MAAPMVTASIALLMTKNPQLTARDAKEIILNKATNYSGLKILNIENALID